MEKRQRPKQGDKLKMERQGPDSTTQESLRYRAETEHDNTAKKNLQEPGLCDHRSTTVQGNMESVCYTPTRVGADITIAR